MSPFLYGKIVKELKDQYFGGVVFLSSKDLMTHEAPACVAAPLVTMVANKAINLGVAGQGSQPVPVRLYVPEQLSITTTHLLLG